MPAVARGDQHGVDVRPLFKKLAHVRIHRAVLVIVKLIHEIFHGKPLLLLNIADRQDLHVIVADHPLKVVKTPAVDADARGSDALRRRHRPIPAQGRCGHDHRGRHGRCRALQELPAIYRSAHTVFPSSQLVAGTLFVQTEHAPLYCFYAESLL